MSYHNHIPPIQQLQQNHPIETQQIQRQIQYHVIHPDSKPKPAAKSEAPVAKKRKVGRPKANLKKKLLEEAEAKKALTESEAFLAQTRCGRKVKVPKGSATFFQVIYNYLIIRSFKNNFKNIFRLIQPTLLTPQFSVNRKCTKK